MQQEIISMKKYILWFSISYFVSSVVAGGLGFYFDIDGNVGVAVGICLASAYVSVQCYIKDHGRALSKSEIWRVTWGSWGSSLLMTLIYIMCISIYFLYDIFGQVSLADIKTDLLPYLGISMNILFGITVFTMIFTLGLTRFAYGVANKALSKRIIARAKY